MGGGRRLVEDLSDREAHVEAMASEIGFGPIEGIVNRRLSNEARAEAASADYQPYGSYTASLTPQRTPQRAGGEGLWRLRGAHDGVVDDVSDP